ncbi:MAG TPA: Fe-Mn family superoxide dismutase [Lachnospiraceae bacterium]|jgi:Fe-Mn family superoxide dismutase|nr:Fe-Mn family superoxide dismutase [Lachnospiraceae bacterium]
MIRGIDFTYNEDITAVNREQFDAHNMLYQNYVKQYNEINEILITNEAERQSSNTVYSKFRCLKRGETYSLDAIIFHELYFENMGGVKNVVPIEFISMIKNQFENFAYWREDFIATAKASRGWAILCYEQRSNRFMNISLDAHDKGVVGMAFPIIVLDTYEHAYYLQYQNDKETYFHNFLDNINWNVVLRRMQILQR